MKIHDMMQDQGRVFLKSEWGQIGDEWPCVSFTKKTVGDRLRAEFRPGRDILIYVGTTNAEFTEEPDHPALRRDDASCLKDLVWLDNDCGDQASTGMAELIQNRVKPAASQQLA